MNKLQFLLLSAIILFSIPVHARWPEIDLQTAPFISTLSTETVTVVKDPVFKTTKRYQAHSLKSVVQRLAQRYTEDLQQAVLVFTAIDGYKVSMAYQDAVEEEGYLAYRDLTVDSGDWERFQFGKETMTPAPFYLVWSKPGIDKWRYPWPFQLKQISIQPTAVYFGEAAPIPGNAEVDSGFATFSRYCIRCHAVNGSGGKVGPELNKPQNITDLYSNDTLKGLILNNPAYRPNSKMPVFSNILKTKELTDILSYLKAMKSLKRDGHEAH